jgi:nitronate monooxygenase
MSRISAMTPSRHSDLLNRLQLDLPIVQAPMAGVSTPSMTAAAANAGALGSMGVGATNAEGAREMIRAARELTRRALNINVFCHQPAMADRTVEAAWIERLRPHFERVGAAPPAALREIYQSFVIDDAMLELFLECKPEVVSFHFGLPSAERIRALRAAGIVLIACATSLDEGRVLAGAGVDAVIAQGYEAGGHRGVFDPTAGDDCLGTFALTRVLVRELDVPVIAAGGIMDGAGIAAALRLGAIAAALGTAFVACPESSADEGYRAALKSDAAFHTVMTAAISGRPARCLPNRFTQLGASASPREIPAYPIAYDVGKSLHAVARTKSEFGYGAQWAGQGAPLARELPTGELVRALAAELEAAQFPS